MFPALLCMTSLLRGMAIPDTTPEPQERLVDQRPPLSVDAARHPTTAVTNNSNANDCWSTTNDPFLRYQHHGAVFAFHSTPSWTASRAGDSRLAFCWHWFTVCCHRLQSVACQLPSQIICARFHDRKTTKWGRLVSSSKEWQNL